MEVLTGDPPDISDWNDFQLYDLVWYWHGEDDRLIQKIGIQMGVAHGCVRNMNDFIFIYIGKLITHTTVKNPMEM